MTCVSVTMCLWYILHTQIWHYWHYVCQESEGPEFEQSFVYMNFLSNYFHFYKEELIGLCHQAIKQLFIQYTSLITPLIIFHWNSVHTRWNWSSLPIIWKTHLYTTKSVSLSKFIIADTVVSWSNTIHSLRTFQRTWKTKLSLSQPPCGLPCITGCHVTHCLPK